MAEKSTVNIPELVQSALEGDTAAYEALYNATSRHMLGLCMSMIRSEQDALDLVQESYLYAFQSLEKLENPAYFETWLHSIAANRCKNFLTRTRPKLFAASLTGEDGGDWDTEDDDIAFRPDQKVDDTETKRLVRELVDALPEDQRLCVLLYYYQDMKVGQIAALLELPDNTVKSRLHYARKKLRAGADELERAGSPLRGVAVLPLLGLAMEGAVSEAGTAIGPAALQGILQGLGTSAAGAGAATGGGSVAAVAAPSAAGGAASASAGAPAAGGLQAFLGTAAGKVTAGVLAASIVAGGAAVVTQLGDDPLPPPQPEAVVSPVEESEPIAEPEPVLEPAPEPAPPTEVPEPTPEPPPEPEPEPSPAPEPEPETELELEPETEPEAPPLDPAAAGGELIRMFNQEKSSAGMPQMAVDPRLMEAAAIRARELSVSYSDYRPDGSGTGAAMASGSIGGMNGSELKAQGYASAAEAMAYWKESKWERLVTANDYDSIGAACYQSGDSVYWVVLVATSA